MNAQLSNAILRFRRSNVNRVLFFTVMGEFHFFYFRQADSQGFTPRYGVSSFDAISYGGAAGLLLLVRATLHSFPAELSIVHTEPRAEGAPDAAAVN